MVFSSLFFLYFFLPICLICYFAFKNITYRNIVLIVFSLIFYAWGEPVWISLLIFSATVDFFHGLIINKFRDRLGAKIALASSLILNLGLLFVFKYSDFIINNINIVFKTDIPPPNFTLPIGISFYTFQTLSYSIDCYWGKVKVQKNYFNFLMYVSLFPQLVAGPIVRYSVIENEIYFRKSDYQNISKGITRIIVGLSKKVIIANNLSTIVDTFFKGDISELPVLTTWYTIIMYSMQVYFDFSGYSDIAIGLGNIFGFNFNENFNHPFICKDITEFWQRWHISLGSFFRDYLLYLPIFGKRIQVLNLFLVWFCTGLWHGASWNYIIWGLYFGIFIFIESTIGKKKMKKIPLIIRHFYSKLIIIIGFGIFFFEDFSRLLDFFKNIIGLNRNALIDDALKVSFLNNLYLIIIAILLCLPLLDGIKELKNKSRIVAFFGNATAFTFKIVLLFTSSIMLVDATNNPFLYFRF